MVMAGVSLSAPSVAAPSKRDLARARALDKEGGKAYAEGRYRDAIKAFEQAYKLGGPAFELWNAAKCYVRLDELDKAGEMLERYLATSNLPKADRDEATSQLDQLKKRPSSLSVTSSPSGAAVTLDGKPLEGQTPITTTIPHGRHTVTITLKAGARPISRQVEAVYGRPVVVDAQLDEDPSTPPPNAEVEGRPPPPDNPYEADAISGKIALRGAFGIVLPKHGSVGGDVSGALAAMGTYRVATVGNAALSVGGLITISGDSWGNRTGQENIAPDCGPTPLAGAQSATALSFFAVGAAGVPITTKLRATGFGGLGLAGYFVDNVGGDLFVPSCKASPGVRPALLLGGHLDYAITPLVHVSLFPVMFQIQPAFDGTRATPRDASGVWMRLTMGIGAGVDL